MDWYRLGRSPPIWGASYLPTTPSGTIAFFGSLATFASETNELSQMASKRDLHGITAKVRRWRNHAVETNRAPSRDRA
ncbi:hypothetical protein BQ8794_110041 [Mesorhizobium prunaredense]|uniref:Uncharacterized protein n=1 Tax=Mesorhizobium prunaredense TaxID=1631249 RepID=A0A1R3V021_9HYPH|nr:hypothetical protein BQ8794_110041 [Mesorhizobium prunaredense]